jgi:ABC-type phosphate/phosphonate transport system substrate-binding protein
MIDHIKPTIPHRDLVKFATGTMLVLALTWSQFCAGDVYVFSAHPHETAEDGQKDYDPIAELLTKATSKRFIYRHSNNWPSYIKDMRSGKFDLIFDGPHFVSWRVAKLGHTPLVRLPGKLDFVIVSRKNDEVVFDLTDLAGHKVCAHTPPNLATLTMQTQFTNPVRQPQIFEINGFKNIYAELLKGKCRGAVIPSALYTTFNNGNSKGKTRILYLSEPLPRQAITAGPRIPENIQTVIRAVLLSPHGSVATRRLRERFANGAQMVTTNKDEYQGFAAMLNNVYGFSW